MYPQVLQKLPHLASCALKACPIAASPDYKQDLQALLPYLQILDGQKLPSAKVLQTAQAPKRKAKVPVSEDLGNKSVETAVNSNKNAGSKRHKAKSLQDGKANWDAPCYLD